MRCLNYGYVYCSLRKYPRLYNHIYVDCGTLGLQGDTPYHAASLEVVRGVVAQIGFDSLSVSDVSATTGAEECWYLHHPM